MLPFSLERLANWTDVELSEQHEFSMDREGFMDVCGASRRTEDRNASKVYSHVCPRSLTGQRFSRCATADGDIARIQQAAGFILQEEIAFGRCGCIRNIILKSLFRGYRGHMSWSRFKFSTNR